MNIKRKTRGVAPVIIILAVALLGGTGYWLGSKGGGGAASPTKAGQAVLDNTTKQEAVIAQIDLNHDKQVKGAQQLVKAESFALEKVTSTEPAVDLLKDLNWRANLALDHGVGALSFDETQWALNLVINKLSEEQAKVAIANKMLADKDKELELSIDKIKSLTSQKVQLETTAKVLEGKLVTEDAIAVAFKDKVMFWVWLIGGGYVFITFILPILSNSFPALKALSNGLGAVISPFLHKAKVEAEKLRNDTIGYAHEVEEKVKNAGVIAAKEVNEIKSQWITQNDGTAHGFDQVKRDMNLL